MNTSNPNPTIHNPAVPWISVPDKAERPPTPVDPDALALGRELGTFIQMGAMLDARSQQLEIGASEIGYPCDRRVVYRLNGTPKVNPIDRKPLRRLIGTGVHHVLASTFDDFDGGRGIFLTEFPVVYRDVPGTVDLIYRQHVIDWKTTTREKIARLRRDGPTRNHEVQLNMYVAGARAAGMDITHWALVFIPIDLKPGEDVDSFYVIRRPFNQAMADDAVDRRERLRGKQPSEVDAKPDRLCSYCAHHNPQSTDLDTRGCPGQS